MSRCAIGGDEERVTEHRASQHNRSRIRSRSAQSSVRPIETNLIFVGEPGRDGKHRPYQLNPVWMKIRRDLGLADVRFHDLRHEAVSRFVGAGFSDQEVSAISGHKIVQMPKRYTHLRSENLVGRLGQISMRK